MKLEDLHHQRYICNFCYPNHQQELMELTKHLVTKGGWVGGFTKEKQKEYADIRKEFEKDRLAWCFMIDDMFSVYICKDHLREAANHLSKLEVNSETKSNQNN